VSSEDVVIQLMKPKCLPSLCYGTDVCPVKKYQLQSFEFVISSSFRKTFNIKTRNLLVNSDFFNCAATSDSVAKRNKKILCKHSACYNNDICSVFVNNASGELSQ